MQGDRNISVALVRIWIYSNRQLHYEFTHFRTKGIAEPVRTYRIFTSYDDFVDQVMIIHHQQNGNRPERAVARG